MLLLFESTKPTWAFFVSPFWQSKVATVVAVINYPITVCSSFLCLNASISCELKKEKKNTQCWSCQCGTHQRYSTVEGAVWYHPRLDPKSSCRCCTGTGSNLTHCSFTWSDKIQATNMTTRILLLITLIISIFITPYFITICFFTS